MKESSICNVIVAKIGDNHYINLKGPEAQQISLQISKPQAEKVVNELSLTIKDYDSQPATESIAGKQLQKSTDDTDL